MKVYLARRDSVTTPLISVLLTQSVEPFGCTESASMWGALTIHTGEWHTT